MDVMETFDATYLVCNVYKNLLMWHLLPKDIFYRAGGC